eukprot:6578586-Pyramimonas_sp.AAC.1
MELGTNKSAAWSKASVMLRNSALETSAVTVIDVSFLGMFAVMTCLAHWERMRNEKRFVVGLCICKPRSIC